MRAPEPHDDRPLEPDDPAATSFSSFDRLVRLCRRTQRVLLAVAEDRETEQDLVRSIIATEALDHVDAILAGVTALARTGSFSQPELRELVRRAGIVAPARSGSPEAIAAWQELRAEERAGARPQLAAIDGGTILAAGHARVVFSVIPTLPPDAVGWPRAHRGYADIPTPRSEAELMARVEELARVLWRVAAGNTRRDEPLRRTLAFYDAGARLSVRGGFLAA
jgi:hypothetical protein